MVFAGLFCARMADQCKPLPVVYGVWPDLHGRKTSCRKPESQRMPLTRPVIVAPTPARGASACPRSGRRLRNFGSRRGVLPSNATNSPWPATIRLYDYVCRQLPQLSRRNFPVSAKTQHLRHSWVAMGADLRLEKSGGAYQSVILRLARRITQIPSQVPWGTKKARAVYLVIIRGLENLDTVSCCRCERSACRCW